jgi:putative ABC transport system substrate-binding protein
MKRREFLEFPGLLGGAVLTAPRVAAQTQRRIYHLGTLTPVAPMTEDSPFGKIVVKALAQRGYTFGQNLTSDARGSMGDIAKIPAMLEQLKARGVDAIIVIG